MNARMPPNQPSMVLDLVELLLSHNNDPARRLRLRGKHWTIGAAPECSVQLEGFLIHPVHAELRIENHGLDLRAVAGSLIHNGVSKHACTLQLDDRFEIGGFRFQVAKVQLNSGEQLAATFNAGERHRIAFSSKMKLEPLSGAESEGKRPRTPEPPPASFQTRRKQVEHLLRRPHFEETQPPPHQPQFQDIAKTLDSRIAGIEEQIRQAAQQAAQWAVGETQRVRETERSLEAERQKFEQQAQSLTVRIAELEEAVTQARREVHAERQASKFAASQVHQMETLIAAIREEHEASRQETEDNVTVLKATVDRLAETLQAERVESQATREEMQAAAQSLKLSVNELSARLVDANRELVESRGELQKVRSQLEQVEQQRNKSLADQQGLQVLLKQAEEQIIQLKNTEHSEAMSLRLANLEEELATLSQERLELSQQRDGLQEAVVKLKEHVTETEAAYQAQQAQWEQRQQGWTLREAEWEQQRKLFETQSTSWQQQLDAWRERENQWLSQKSLLDQQATDWKSQQAEVEKLRADWEEERELLETAIRQLQEQVAAERSVAAPPVPEPYPTQAREAHLPQVDSFVQNALPKPESVLMLLSDAVSEPNPRPMAVDKVLEDRSFAEEDDHPSHSLDVPYAEAFSTPQGSTHSPAIDYPDEAGSSDHTEMPNSNTGGMADHLPSWWTGEESGVVGQDDHATYAFHEGFSPSDALGDSAGDFPNWAHSGTASDAGEETPSGPAASSDSLALLLSMQGDADQEDDRTHLLLDVGPVAKPPAAKESVADVLARMGHQLEEDEPVSGRERDSAPEPARTPPPPSRQTPHSSVPEEEDEASIEAYMSRLLARMQGKDEDSAEVASKPISPKPETVVTPPVTRTSAFPTKPKSQPAVNSGEFTPRAPAPERSTDIAAMRELANSTARTAIAVSARRKAIGAAATKISVCVIAGITGVVLLFWSGMTMSIPTILAGLCFAATVIWGYDAYATARQTMRDALRAEKREQTETVTPISDTEV